MKYMYSFLVPAIVAIPVNTAFAFFEKYIFSDWEFLIYLSILVMIDTGLAWIHHCSKKTFSSKGFAMIFNKFIVYGVLLVLANAAKEIDTEGRFVDNVGDYVSSLICWSLFMREGFSIVEKASHLGINLVPKKILTYFEKYEDDDFSDKRKDAK